MGEYQEVSQEMGSVRVVPESDTGPRFGCVINFVSLVFNVVSWLYSFVVHCPSFQFVQVTLVIPYVFVRSGTFFLRGINLRFPTLDIACAFYREFKPLLRSRR